MGLFYGLMHIVAEAGTTISFDTAWMTQLIEIVKTVLTLLVEFPCNLFLAGGLAGLGFGIFRKAKKTAR